MSEFGIRIMKTNEKEVKVERETRESRIEASIDSGERREFKINSGMQFLNHMIETIAWRACMNIDLKTETTNYELKHVIAEDSGIVLGKAFAEILANRIPVGVNGSGCASAIIDEAKAFAAVSFEGRANCFVERNCDGSKITEVDGMYACDLVAFLEGFAQGGKLSARMDLEKGRDPHHTWESGFRALGEALKSALSPNSWRKNTTAGVKGTLE